MEKIRKVSVAQGGISEDRVMNYVVGNNAYGDYKVVLIEEDELGCTIYIKNSEDELLPWKKFNKSVAYSLEYSLDYDYDYDI